MAKVLIVDDKESNLFALENILRRLDVEVVKALSGEQALCACLNHAFALAILDVQMPAMDGYELAALLRSDKATCDIPIIFLSAVYSTEPYVFRGYAAGGVDFITKPFDPQILLSKVEVFLDLHDQKTTLKEQKTRLEMLVCQLEEQVEARRQAEENLRRNNEALEKTVAARTADLAETVAALRSANEQLSVRAGQLRALAGELTMAEYRQRQYLSRLLHDGLQQHLAIAKLQVCALPGCSSQDEFHHAVSGVENLIVECIQVSRSLSAELSPPVLYKNGLSAGLTWLAAWMMEKHAFHVDMRFESEAGLPEDVKILVFESVRELLFNAAKHSGEARAKVRVYPGGRGWLRIGISDEGTGFDVAGLKPAGDPGAGFGLFSIRERIELIGGKLQIDSAPGKGSRFTLSVPLASESAAQSDLKGLSEQAGAGAAGKGPDDQGASIYVLIVDDHGLVRETLTRLIQREPDLTVVGQACDGKEAIDMAGRLKPDVILMDVKMPGVNGIEATRVIMGEVPAIRIIGLSMEGDPICEKHMREAGAADFRDKNCSACDLLSAIRDCGRGCSQRGPDKANLLA
jgi:DNA-binding NarL/FixJ family response regulator